MQKILNKIAGLIKRVIISEATVDNGTGVSQVFVNHAGSKILMNTYFPFGYHAVPRPGDRGLALSVAGQNSNQAILIHSEKDRPPDLEPGENVVYHPDTESFVAFFNNGNIVLETSVGNVFVNSTTGQIQIEADGDVNVIAGGSATVTAPTITLTGDVTITGNVAIVGSTLTHNGTNVGSTHVHSGVQAGGSNTGTPV